VEFPGQVGQVARVSLNPVYQLDIEYSLMELHTSTSSAAIYEKSSNIKMPIDPLMLDSFIENTKGKHDKAVQENLPNKEKYRQTLLRNFFER